MEIACYNTDWGAYFVLLSVGGYGGYGGYACGLFVNEEKAGRG